MKVFIGMETSGVTRAAFAKRGHDVISCDILPADDAVPQILGINAIAPMICDISCISSQTTPRICHIVGDVFEVLVRLKALGWWPQLALFHPTCTFHTVSAAWAFGDGPYHQKVKPGTLVGQARREARDRAEADVRRIWDLDIEQLAVENPIGTLSSRWMPPSQIIQPNWFGDDASKATCLWLRKLPKLVPTLRIAGRLVEWPRGSGKIVQRWANQTDSGQNNLTPGADRWKERSRTYPGPADAMAAQWGIVAQADLFERAA